MFTIANINVMYCIIKIRRNKLVVKTYIESFFLIRETQVQPESHFNTHTNIIHLRSYNVTSYR